MGVSGAPAAPFRPPWGDGEEGRLATPSFIICMRIRVCFAGGRVMAAVEANARKKRKKHCKRQFTMPRAPCKYPALSRTPRKADIDD